MDINKIKNHLNNLIENDKKHIRIYDSLFDEYKKSLKDNKNFFFSINNQTYKIIDVIEIKKENETNASFYLNVISELNKLEEKEFKSWIVEHLEYLKNRVYSIYESGNNIYLYKFKKSIFLDGDVVLNV